MINTVNYVCWFVGLITKPFGEYSPSFICEYPIKFVFSLHKNSIDWGCYWELSNIRLLTHWVQYKIQAVMQTTFSNTHSWMKIYEFWLIFSLKSVPKGPVNNISVLVQIMAWRWSGDKPLFEPMMVNYWSIYSPLGLNEYFFFIRSNFCKMPLVWSERTWHFRLQLRKLLW